MHDTELVAEMKAILSGEMDRDEVYDEYCLIIFNAAMELRNYHSNTYRWNSAAHLSETLIPFSEKVGGLEKKHIKLLERDIEKFEREKGKMRDE